MKTYPRSDRIGGLIHKSLSNLMQKEISDPRLAMVTITGVKVSRDLRKADIFFSISGGEVTIDEATQGFSSALGYIKRILAGQLGLRYMPELIFRYDTTFDYGSKIDYILQSLKISGIDGADH